MSYKNKKPRLDPETPIQGTSRNLLGASDNGARGFIDTSSFSSSTSGGSGGYTGPFRTRYSHPLHVPSPNSLSRFAPHIFGRERRSAVKVPLIRARRDESESEGVRPSSRTSLNSSVGGGGDGSSLGTTSSTAQRIIETLHNMSTPVMNAGKIRIDQPIKAVQPLGFGGGSTLTRHSTGSSLNRSTGPPKMCSSLLLSNPSPSNQINPVSNYGDHHRLFYIPKMIDAATNTDKNSEAISPSSVLSKSNKLDEVKTLTPSHLRHGVGVIASEGAKDDNSDDEFHECNSDFAFSSGWSPDFFDGYFTNAEQDKSQPPLLNGYKDASLVSSATKSSSFTPNVSTFVSHPSPNTGIKAPALGSSSNKFGFGASSPLKNPMGFGKSVETSNASTTSYGETLQKSSIGCSVSSTGFKFGSTTSTKVSEPTNTFSFGKEDSSKDDKPKSSVFDNVDAGKSKTFIFSKSPSFDQPSLVSHVIKKAKWRCTTCLVENAIDAKICVCCNGKCPSLDDSKKTEPTPAKKKWRCPTCMIENDFDVPACICCTEKNPNHVPSAKSAPTKKWRCPTCMVENDFEIAACVCCSEKNPNATIINETNKKDAGSTTGFKFGLSSSSSMPPSSGSSNASFFGQQAPNDQTSDIPTFKFGAPPSTTAFPSAIPTTSTVTSNVTFGGTTTTSSSLPTATNTPLFSSSGTTPPKRPGFGMTSPTTTQPSSTTNFMTTSSNLFGASKPADIIAPVSTSSGGFSFGSGTFSNQSASASQPTSNFASPNANNDATKPTTGFSFGSKSATDNKTFSFGNSASQPAASPTTPANTSLNTNTSNLFGTSKSDNTAASVGPVFGPGNFQSSTQPTTNSNFNFGPSKTTDSADTQKTSGFNFTPAAAKPFGSNSSSSSGFAFSNSQQQSGSQPTTQPSLLTPAATASFSFGSNATAGTGAFGQAQPPANSAAQPGGVFQFNAASSAAASPAPGFNQTPNFNFSSVTPAPVIPSFGSPIQPTPTAGAQPPNTLFSFNATPSTADRKIKTARRRKK